MPNHYHAVVQTPRANLSQAVGWVQSTYGMRFNTRHRRAGHLFQGRFKAHLVEADSYAARLIVYIHLNPVRPQDKRARIPSRRRGELDRYMWSSHRAYAGLSSKKETPDWLCLDWLSYFGNTKRWAQERYKEQITESFGSVAADPFADLRGGLVLGGERVWSRVKGLLDKSKDEHVVRWRARATQPEQRERAAELVRQEGDRRLQIWLRVRVGGEETTAVARSYGYRHASGVTRVIQRLEARAKQDRRLAGKLTALSASGNPSNVKG
jgi:hypothetical protein